MSDSPKPLSDTLEHPLQSRLLSAATSTAALIDRAQLAERQGRTQEARALYEQALTQLRTPEEDRKSTRLNSSHPPESRMPSSA